MQRKANPKLGRCSPDARPTLARRLPDARPTLAGCSSAALCNRVGTGCAMDYPGKYTVDVFSI
jgi:hypothetical protein